MFFDLSRPKLEAHTKNCLVLIRRHQREALFFPFGKSRKAILFAENLVFLFLVCLEIKPAFFLLL